MLGGVRGEIWAPLLTPQPREEAGLRKRWGGGRELPHTSPPQKCMWVPGGLWGLLPGCESWGQPCQGTFAPGKLPAPLQLWPLPWGGGTSSPSNPNTAAWLTVACQHCPPPPNPGCPKAAGARRARGLPGQLQPGSDGEQSRGAVAMETRGAQSPWQRSCVSCHPPSRAASGGDAPGLHCEPGPAPWMRKEGRQWCPPLQGESLGSQHPPSPQLNGAKEEVRPSSAPWLYHSTHHCKSAGKPGAVGLDLRAGSVVP